MTNGIGSAVGRAVSEPQGGGSPGTTLPDMIQTSASINPGNSGGALVNLADQVAGVPTLAATDQQLGGGAAPGIGFAISANIVKDIAAQLVAHGKVVDSYRAALGIRAATVSGPDGQPAGVGIFGVQNGGGAAKAGLKTGEVITKVDGTATSTEQDLAQVLANLSPGRRSRSRSFCRAGPQPPCRSLSAPCLGDPWVGDYLWSPVWWTGPGSPGPAVGCGRAR